MPTSFGMLTILVIHGFETEQLSLRWKQSLIISLHNYENIKYSEIFLQIMTRKTAVHWSWRNWTKWDDKSFCKKRFKCLIICLYIYLYLWLWSQHHLLLTWKSSPLKKWHAWRQTLLRNLMDFLKAVILQSCCEI